MNGTCQVKADAKKLQFIKTLVRFYVEQGFCGLVKVAMLRY